MTNEELPSNESLLPGSASFSNHPGYTAQDCELREVVRALTYATNNGFRCHMTGGHCLPGDQCSSRREQYAILVRQEAEFAAQDEMMHWCTRL